MITATNGTDTHRNMRSGRLVRNPKAPVLDEAALYGIAGDVVRAGEPYTEADTAAVLVSFIVSFGNCVGRSPHTYVSETRHGINLSSVIVGATSRSRKGTSSGLVNRIMRHVDSDWASNRQADGIGSGEAIIWAIRDASDPVEGKRGESIVEDHGISDKRLMIAEQEFAGVLKVQSRDGSIASEIFRKSWDSPEELRNLVKRSPVKASNPHISVLGHVTRDELRRELTETDKANGIGNRILWVHAERSKLLPDAPRVSEDVVAELAARIGAAVRFARTVSCMPRTPEASKQWRTMYPMISRDYPGMFGALTARAEAQVLRLSMIYALLDCSNMIDLPHLTAALAFWQYCEDSVRYIFGDGLGDPIADRILDALRTSPEMSETRIHDLFHRNQRADRISGALETLRANGLAVMEQRTDTNGRPARIWKAVAP